MAQKANNSVFFTESLLHHTLLQILGQIGVDGVGEVFGGNLLHVVLHHDLDELVESGGLGIPSEFLLGFGRVAPEIDHVGWTVEVGRDLNKRFANQ